MGKVIITLNEGDAVINVPGAQGVLVSPAAVDFGEVSRNILAENFASAGRVDLLKYLEHRDEETGLLVRYNTLGTRIVVTEEQEEGLREFEKVRDAVEEGVEEVFDVLDEEKEDEISDKIAEKVARSTDAITSPSEAAEAAAATQSPSPGPDPAVPPAPVPPLDIPPAPPQPIEGTFGTGAPPPPPESPAIVNETDGNSQLT